MCFHLVRKICNISNATNYLSKKWPWLHFNAISFFTISPKILAKDKVENRAINHNLKKRITHWRTKDGYRLVMGKLFTFELLTLKTSFRFRRVRHLNLGNTYTTFLYCQNWTMMLKNINYQSISVPWIFQLRIYILNEKYIREMNVSIITPIQLVQFLVEVCEYDRKFPVFKSSEIAQLK